MVKKIAVSLFAFSLTACHLLDQKVPSHDELLEKELGAIDWKQVDQYPTVAGCDSLATVEAKNACFTTYLAAEVQERLGQVPLKVFYPELDTIDVRVIVASDSTVRFEPIWNESWAYSREAIDSVLQIRLADFPKISPAIKRDLPVTTAYILPIYLQLNAKR